MFVPMCLSALGFQSGAWHLVWDLLLWVALLPVGSHSWGELGALMVLTFLGPSGHCSSVSFGWKLALSFQYEGLPIRLVERESGGARSCRCVSSCATTPLNMWVRWNSWGRLQFAYVGRALSFFSWVQFLPCAHTRGRVVLRWCFSKTGFACVTSSNMVSEFATPPALVWKAKIENLLSYCVYGYCSFRHGWDSDESRELKDILDLYRYHGAGQPLDVWVGDFNVQDLAKFAYHDGKRFGIPELFMQVWKLYLYRMHEERFRSLRICIKVWRKSWEGKAEPTPFYCCKFPCSNGSFLVLKEDQEVAPC